jgi:hypothetical protein
MERYKRGLLTLLIFFGACLAPPAMAEEAYVSDVVVTSDGDHLLVYFTVNDCFTIEMGRAIESGLETSFTFFVELYERRGFWWDKSIESLKLKHSIKYDSLKRFYEVTLSENENEVVTVKDFEEAKRLMSEVVALKVMSLKKLKKGNHYQLQIMAEMDKIRLPLYLHYVFFFLSLWDFKTDWYKVNFNY